MATQAQNKKAAEDALANHVEALAVLQKGVTDREFTTEGQIQVGLAIIAQGLGRAQAFALLAQIPDKTHIRGDWG